jgi:hypothetical protein
MKSIKANIPLQELNSRVDASAKQSISEYQDGIDRVLIAFGTDARLGLSGDEARARLVRYGKNDPISGK